MNIIRTNTLSLFYGLSNTLFLNSIATRDRQKLIVDLESA